MSTQEPPPFREGREGRAGLAVRLGILLALALVLRVWGLGWSLPDAWHYNSYHGGESRAVAVGLQMDLRAGDLEPRWRGRPYFNWGSHYIYAAYFANFLAAELGFLDLPEEARQNGDWSAETFARAHLVARAVSALYGAAIVLVVWALARAAFGARTALGAALLVAVCPLLAYQSRFATVNSCLAFWTTAALALQYAAARRATLPAFGVAGIGAGLAVAVKLSALPLCGTGLVAVLLAAIGRRERGLDVRFALGAVAVAALGTVVGFGLASPYAFVHWDVFREQLMVELRHGEEGHGLVFAGTGSGLAHMVLVNLPVGLGWPLWAAALVGLGWSALALARGSVSQRARERSPAFVADALALAWIGANVFVLARANTRFLRYLMPLAPVLCLLAARALWEITALIRRPARDGAAVWGVAGGVALALVALPTLFYTAATVRPFAALDPRDAARAWVSENVSDGATLGFVKPPCHVTPPLYPVAPGPAGFPPGAPRYRGVKLNADPEKLLAEKPEWILLNTVELYDELRLGRDETGRPRSVAELRASGLDETQLRAVQNGVRFQELLERSWGRVESWQNRPALLGIDVGWSEPPQGWAAAVQEIEVWRRAER